MKSAPLLTIGGTLVDCFDPRPGILELKLWEVGHALSQLVRFTGNMFGTYTVAQHSVHMLEELSHGDERLKRAALFHDAAEMFVGDLPGPLKRALGPEYKQVELGIEEALAERFDFDFPLPSIIKRVDLQLLQAEMRDMTAWPLEGHIGQSQDPTQVGADEWPPALERELAAWTTPYAYQKFMVNARKVGAQ